MSQSLRKEAYKILSTVYNLHFAFKVADRQALQDHLQSFITFPSRVRELFAHFGWHFRLSPASTCGALATGASLPQETSALEALIANPAKTTPPFESPTTWPLSRCIFLSSSYSTLKEWMCQQIRSPGHRIKPSRSRIIQELSSNPRALRWGRWGTADMIARSTSSWRGKTSRHC